MSPNRAAPTVIYPLLGAEFDLGFVRVAGHGLGNCFFTYFHAVVLADKWRALMVAPPWFSLKLRPLLRGSVSKRLYWRMFKPCTRDIHGVGKLALLLRGYHRRVTVRVGGASEPVVVPGALNLVKSARFTFAGLHEHRTLIRDRLLAIVNEPIPPDHRWGASPYIAVHVRLGDFSEAKDAARIERGEPNLRIPLRWYTGVIQALRRRFAALPLWIFSDGEERQLAPLLRDGASLYRSGSDVTDLLAMAGASVLVGSNSTYSRWAAFLGGMPSIWLQTAATPEAPSGSGAAISYVPLDDASPKLWT